MPRTVPARLAAVVALIAATTAFGCAASTSGPGTPASATSAPAARAAPAVAPTPVVTVTTMVSGLSHPWDIAFTPDGTTVFDQRGGGLSVRTPRGTVRRLRADFGDLLASGETGLMAIVVDPGFATNRQLYTCQGHAPAPRDIRVVKWRIDPGYTTAQRLGTVVTGIAVTTGRHGGCRLRFDTAGLLHIGTGDAATGTNPQNLNSLNGKTLRVRTDGTVPVDNPFAGDPNRNKRLVYTYGHRNVQGLALRPGRSQLWNAEHGPLVDDEVNLLVRGANYGWDPVPGYNENVPMTDLRKFPRAVPAAWRSGGSTVATSGAAFLVGPRWGRWQGALVVAALKGRRLLVLTLDARDRVVASEVWPGSGRYGRLRTAQLGPDGSLYVTTDNGRGDTILRLTARG